MSKPLPALQATESADLPARLAPLPVIVVDTREQDPLPIRRLATLRAGLTSGDYSIAGAEHLFAVERKSITDLIACCGPERERFERELHRPRGFRFARLLVIGAESDVATGGFRSRMSPRAVLASVRAFEARYNLPVVWQPDPDEAGRQIERWAAWFAYDIARCAEAVAKGMTRVPNEAVPPCEP